MKFPLPFIRGSLVMGFGGHRANLVRPRWVARVWAKAFGYFWLPCPICEQKFAGFEWGTSIFQGPHVGHGCCARPSCVQQAAKINEGWVSPFPELEFNPIKYYDPDSLFNRFMGIKGIGSVPLWFVAAWDFGKYFSDGSYFNLAIGFICVALACASLWFDFYFMPRYRERNRKWFADRMAELERQQAERGKPE